METRYEKEDKTDRKFVEIDRNIAKNLELLCFLKDIPRKQFATEAIKKELKQYETWIEKAKQLQFRYS